jgi:hypothetical protein
MCCGALKVADDWLATGGNMIAAKLSTAGGEFPNPVAWRPSPAEQERRVAAEAGTPPDSVRIGVD